MFFAHPTASLEILSAMDRRPLLLFFLTRMFGNKAIKSDTIYMNKIEG